MGIRRGRFCRYRGRLAGLAALRCRDSSGCARARDGRPRLGSAGGLSSDECRRRIACRDGCPERWRAALRLCQQHQGSRGEQQRAGAARRGRRTAPGRPVRTLEARGGTGVARVRRPQWHGNRDRPAAAGLWAGRARELPAPDGCCVEGGAVTARRRRRTSQPGLCRQSRRRARPVCRRCGSRG
jgi:hypothetical protein